VKHPSASNAEAFVRCTASHVLPQHEAYLARTESGTDNHDVLTGVINKRLGAAERMAKLWPGFAFAELVSGVDALTAELAFVVNVKERTSRCVGKEIGREYAKALGRPLTAYELGVSLDAAGVKNGVHWVRDWKFGRYSSWWQLYIQAMAVLWQPGQANALEVDAGFIHLLDEGEEDAPEMRSMEDAHPLYLVDLDDRADELVKAFEYASRLEALIGDGSLLTSEVRTTEGKWCEYCGAYPHCPSKWKLVKGLVDMDIAGSIDAMTLEQCGVAWKKLSEIEKNIVKKAKDVLKERMAVEGGFPLENGKRLKLVNMPGRESLDREGLVVLLRKYNVPQHEIAAIFKDGQPYTQVREVKR
jgi:hypothetical protein